MSVFLMIQEWANRLDFAPADDREAQKKTRAVALGVMEEMRKYLQTMACQRCGQLHPEVPHFTVPPPYGSLNAKQPLKLCPDCHGELVRLTFSYVGRPIPSEFAKREQRN